MNETDQDTLNLRSSLRMLVSTDMANRVKARKYFINLGKPAVSSLTIALQHSKDDQYRYEAAKLLVEINDIRSIPSFVKALEDSNIDITRLAVEALRKFKIAAWPPLLRMIIKRNSDSVAFRKKAYMVFLNQKEDGFNDLLNSLKMSLKSSTAHKLSTITAKDILERMANKF